MKQRTWLKWRCLFVLFALSLPATAGFAQANVESFGQNRVQYRKFEWRYFDTEHFRIYHYERYGQALARYVAEQAEGDIKIIERRLGGRFPSRFNIILYNNYDEYRQTNVGLKLDNQLTDVPAGMVDLVGDKLVVYFDGIHTHLRRQLRAGMSRVVMQRMLFGESFKEMVRNAVLMNLPEWTTAGYIAYLVDGWDASSESQWKNLMAANPGKGFYELSEKDAELAGRAFWKWINDAYGDEVIRSTIFMMQLKSSLNQGLKMNLGMKVRQAYDSCMAFYKTTFAADSSHFQYPDPGRKILDLKVPADGGRIQNIRVSPRGRDVAYVHWKAGEYQVYIQKTDNEQQRALILSGGRTDYNEIAPDPNYPLLAWSNNGFKLAILYRKGRSTRLRIYDAIKAKIVNHVIPENRFDRVLGMSFNEDNDQIIFSAIRRGQTDLYGFTLRGSRMTHITNDIWDDVQPQFVSGGSRRGILFLSNRPAPNMDVPAGVNEMATGPMNLFFYDTKTESRELLQITFAENTHITQPIQYGPDNFAYLSDSNGIWNKYVVFFGRNAANKDSAISVPVTNYGSSILSHQYNPAGDLVADVVQSAGKYQVFTGPLVIPDVAAPKTLQPTLLSAKKSSTQTAEAAAHTPGGISPAKPKPFVQSGNIYESEFGSEPLPPAPKTITATEQPAADTSLLDVNVVDSTYLKMRSQPYRLNFKPDFFSVKLDNTVLFNRYQPVETYSNPDLGGMITVSLNDMLENHRFTGGIRLPVTFSGMGYFLQYQNFTRRADWGLLFLRTSENQNRNVLYTDIYGNPIFIRSELLKVSTNYLQGSYSYPLDRIRSVRAHLGLRQDNLDFKAQDTISLNYLPSSKKYWAMMRVEYVFDNSNPLDINLRQGFRYKFYGEYMQPLNKSVNYGDGGAESDTKGFYNFGLDFRYYKKIYKNTIFAARLAGAHSAGHHHILYTLGGVDNWLFPKTSNAAPPVTDQNYAFQALATSLRGYPQNARNGNTYAVANLELRFPVFTTLLKRPVQSGFLRHMQLIGFTDVGSAWNGLLPNTEAFNRDMTLYSPPVLLQLELAGQNGLALGYGAGLRTMLLGYFIRVDAGWNIEGNTKPVWHVSFGTDF